MNHTAGASVAGFSPTNSRAFVWVFSQKLAPSIVEVFGCHVMLRVKLFGVGFSWIKTPHLSGFR